MLTEIMNFRRVVEGTSSKTFKSFLKPVYVSHKIKDIMILMKKKIGKNDLLPPLYYESAVYIEITWSLYANPAYLYNVAGISVKTTHLKTSRHIYEHNMEHPWTRRREAASISKWNN